VPISYRLAAAGEAGVPIGRVTIRGLLDTVFPVRCALCRSWLSSSSDPLCPPCGETVRRVASTAACPRCASTVGPFGVAKGCCGRCRGHRLPVEGTVRAGPYDQELGHLIRGYKFRGREELRPLLGGWLADVVMGAPWFDELEAVVSVPTHWRHRLGRPLYAAHALARFVSRRADLPHVPVLRRVRGGPHQLGLSHSARQENVRGAFRMAPGTTLHEARLLLVDDVKTTGATIHECARVLRRNGAAAVFAAVVVTADWHEPTDQAPVGI